MAKMTKILASGVATCIALGACAGRTPQPVAVSQVQDSTMNCAAIQAEIQANTSNISDLSSEEGSKVAQNVAAGVAGIFIWPLWFAMDFQDAAGKEGKALQARNQYLGALALDRCNSTVQTQANGWNVSIN